MPAITYRDLTTLEEFAQVVDLERVVWGPGYVDVVPTPILTVTVKRGGILIGAFHEPERDSSTGSGSSGATSRDEALAERPASAGRLIGFVYSLPGIKDGKPTQWSHMLGVLDEFRRDGVGRQLKLLQRERALAMGLELIEWTFDPLQAMNAYLNFAKLGVVSDEYEENIYGESASPLHKDNPTDRLVAEWWIRVPPRPRENFADAQPVNRTARSGEWIESVDVDLSIDATRLTIEIPIGFTDMLARAPELAMAWRICTRAMFTTYFDRGYRAVDFFLDTPNATGSYLLSRSAAL
jgi:predicted GNAT superfamily acetyltransferase